MKYCNSVQEYAHNTARVKGISKQLSRWGQTLGKLCIQWTLIIVNSRGVIGSGKNNRVFLNLCLL